MTMAVREEIQFFCAPAISLVLKESATVILLNVYFFLLSVHKGGISATATSSSSSLPTTSHNSTAASTSTKLPTLFSGVAVYFYNIPEEVQKKLRRFLIAYPC